MCDAKPTLNGSGVMIFESSSATPSIKMGVFALDNSHFTQNEKKITFCFVLFSDPTYTIKEEK